MPVSGKIFQTTDTDGICKRDKKRNTSLDLRCHFKPIVKKKKKKNTSKEFQSKEQLHGRLIYRKTILTRKQSDTDNVESTNWIDQKFDQIYTEKGTHQHDSHSIRQLLRASIYIRHWLLNQSDELHWHFSLNHISHHPTNIFSFYSRWFIA